MNISSFWGPPHVINDVPHLSYLCCLVLLLFFFWLVPWPEKWQAWQGIWQGILWTTKKSLCLANQPANMSDDAVYSLHTAACPANDQAEQIIWIYHWKSTNTFVSITAVGRSQHSFAVMLTELKRTRMPKKNMPFLFHLTAVLNL